MPQEIQRGLPAALAVGFNNDAGSIGCGRAAGLDTSPVRYVAAARKRKSPTRRTGQGCDLGGKLQRHLSRPKHSVTEKRRMSTTFTSRQHSVVSL